MARTLLTLTIALLLLAPVALAQDAASAAEDVAALKAEVQRLRAELQAARARIAELEGRVVTAEQTSEDLKVERDRLEELAGVTAKGDTIESADALITTSYDESTDTTTVRTPPMELYDLDGLLDGHAIALAYTHPGKTLEGEPATIRFLLLTVDRSSTRNRAAKSLTLDLDGKPIEIPQAEYTIVERKRLPKGRGAFTNLYSEQIEYDMTHEQLRMLARASQVEAVLLSTDLKVSREVLAMAGALKARIALANGPGESK